jgi:Asp/Glu/hydantoin racemase
MPTLLLINPNTSASVTETLRRRALEQASSAGAGAAVRAVTARFGAPYISDEVSLAVAAHASLDCFADDRARHGDADAVLIGCFGDPGLEALRELAGARVHGLAEAAMVEAARRGRFAIVTGGRRWPPVLRRLAHGIGVGDALAGIEVVDRTGAELAADEAAAHELLLGACRAAIDRYQPDCLVLGGAALTPMAAALAGRLPVPLLDSVETALQVTWATAQRSAAAAPRVSPPPPSAGLDDLGTRLAAVLNRKETFL